MNISHRPSRPRLLIIGGGFAGLNLAKTVDKRRWDVTLVDRHNYHSFPPLFYQVASSGLESSDICFPFRREMRSRKVKGVRYRLGDVKAIDFAAKQVRTQFETIAYDSLVIAAGTTNNFFGIPDLREHVYTIKSVAQAIRCRNEVLDRLERAAISSDPAVKARLLTFVVVGGGPAGVEIAGALGEMKRYVIPREYPGLSREEMKVILVESSDALLRAMSKASGEDAFEALGRLMVDVRLGKTVKAYENGVVSFTDGSAIETETVIWTAGVTGETFSVEGTEAAPGPGNRWLVDEYNRVEGLPDVYAIGDIALHVSSDYPRGCPQVAQVAIQQARNLGRNLSSGRFDRPFKYKDKGSMATIGRNKAVVDIGKIHLSGWPAWAAWMGVHLMSLLGMRNKAVVLLNWMVSYFTFSAGLRLMLRPSKYPLHSYWDK